MKFRLPCFHCRPLLPWRGPDRRAGQRPWGWASRNQRSLSSARDTSVKRSEVVGSPISADCWMARRTLAATVAIWRDSASTCWRPSTTCRSYSAILDVAADCRVVPCAAPPERHHALGEKVAVLLHALRHVVEQLVQRDELGPLHVPVGVLRLVEEIDHVREACVQQRHQALARPPPVCRCESNGERRSWP